MDKCKKAIMSKNNDIVMPADIAKCQIEVADSSYSLMHKVIDLKQVVDKNIEKLKTPLHEIILRNIKVNLSEHYSIMISLIYELKREINKTHFSTQIESPDITYSQEDWDNINKIKKTNKKLIHVLDLAESIVADIKKHN